MMLPTGSRGLASVVGLAALVTLGACAGSPSPVGPKEQSPVLAPPVEPAALDERDTYGARAAADHFLALYGYTYQSGDVIPLELFCADDNYACSALRDEVAAQEELGLTWTGGELTWTGEPTVVREDDFSGYVVEGSVTKSAVTAYGPDGAVALTAPAYPIEATITVDASIGQWYCTGMTLMPG